MKNINSFDKIKKDDLIMKLRKSSSAFTIIELIVVIVVIGILTAIMAISYAGIANKAKETSIKQDLISAARYLGEYKSSHQVYPNYLNDVNNGKGVSATKGNTFSYYFDMPKNEYVLTASNGDVNYRIASYDTKPVRFYKTSFVSTWGGNSTDVGLSIAAARDGGYVATGQTNSYGEGNGDMFISKYKEDGTLDWSKTWGGSALDAANAVVATNDGGYVVSGETNSFGAGSSDVYIAKFDKDGALVWNNTWGGTGIDHAHDMVLTSDGGFIVTGETMSFGAGSNDMFIAKYTKDGEFSWSQTWGGAATDKGLSVAITRDGGYVVSGETYSFGAGSNEMFVVKYTANGKVSWNKTWGGSGQDHGHTIVSTVDGGYLVTGMTQSFGIANEDMVIAKYDANGNLSWNKTWGGLNSDWGQSITATNDNGYLVSGYTNSFGAGGEDIFISKYTFNGTLSWSKTWGGASHEECGPVVITTDGGFLIAGRTDSYGSGGLDMFMSKYDNVGEIKNCQTSMCKIPTGSTTTPSATILSPSATVTTPSATVTTPSATTFNPSVTTTVVVSP